MKKLAAAISVLMVLSASMLGLGLWRHNHDSERPATAELQASFDRAVSWLESNRTRVMKERNPALWWMIKNASEVMPGEALREFYKPFETRHIVMDPDNPWLGFFDRTFKPDLSDPESMTRFKDYQLFLIYGLSCDAKLASNPIVRAQLDPDYCTFHFLKPRCVTHQLISVRLLAKRNCESRSRLDALIEELQATITTELTWDFRIGDAFIQRLLALQESGAGQSIKPAWVEHFLAAQNDDGGWDDIDPILKLPGGDALSHTSRFPRVTRQQNSNLHATAQAVWLLALLIQD